MQDIIRITNNGKDKYFVSGVKITASIGGDLHEDYTVVTVRDCENHKAIHKTEPRGSILIEIA